MKLIKAILAVNLLIVAAAIVRAVSINPASNALADSAATALTIIYRDANADFAAAAATLTGLTVTGTSTLTGAISTTSGSVSISSSSTSNVPLKFVGMYTSTELSTKTGQAGDMAMNVTLTSIVVGTGTTASAGAWVLPRSTSTTANLVVGY